jgi:hypothetical protein
MKTCPACHADVSAEPNGMCPSCLLKKGLDAGPMQCTKCENVLDEGVRFCPQCGSAVVSPSGDALRSALEAKLLGHYRIVRLIGHGGMGAVYLARDLALDREVAVKVVKTSESRQVYDRLRREARTAAKLSHPNIVPLHAFGEVEGMPYFVMGYVRGESLAERLRRDRKLSENEGRRMVAEVADALDHAHRQGVVHRDIKPDNVLIDDESGRAMLTDFGIARVIGGGGTMTEAGSVIGTPHFMSPEQASGRGDIDARSDIYSLGVMAYAMFAGRLPFEGATTAEVLAKHLTQEAAPLRSLAPDVSESTAQIVERCLGKDPANRWPDARSLKESLGAIEEDDHLPDGLQPAEGNGLPGLAISLAFLFFLAMTRPPATILVLNVGVLLVIYLIALISLRRDGFGFARSQRAIWTEPSWWPFWYPRALRRRGNVYDRLPRVIRTARAVPLGGLAFVTFIVVWCVVTRSFPNLYRHPWLFATMMLGIVTFIVTWDIVIYRCRRELKRRGLGRSDINSVSISMPLNRASFWRRPHIAAVLERGTEAVTSRSESPHDQLQAILRNAENLAGPLRPFGAEAAVAARRLLASISDLDSEITHLGRSVEPGEEERLNDKIALLDADDELRILLEKQLELMRDATSRIEAAKEKRTRRIDTLRALAMHVASLRGRSIEESADVRALTDRVRTLCDEITQQAGMKQDAFPTVAR